MMMRRLHEQPSDLETLRGEWAALSDRLLGGRSPSREAVVRTFKEELGLTARVRTRLQGGKLIVTADLAPHEDHGPVLRLIHGGRLSRPLREESFPTSEGAELARELVVIGWVKSKTCKRLIVETHAALIGGPLPPVLDPAVPPPPSASGMCPAGVWDLTEGVLRLYPLTQTWPMGAQAPAWGRLNEVLCLDLMSAQDGVEAMEGVLSSRHADFEDMATLASRMGLASWAEGTPQRYEYNLSTIRHLLREGLHRRIQERTAPMGLTWTPGKLGLLESSHGGSQILIRAMEGHVRVVRPSGHVKAPYRGGAVNFPLRDEAAQAEALNVAADWFVNTLQEMLSLTSPEHSPEPL